MSEPYDAWLDRVAAGEKPTAASLARSAIGEVPKADAAIRYPMNKSIWPPEVWAEMEAVRRGERDGKAA